MIIILEYIREQMRFAMGKMIIVEVVLMKILF